MFYTTRPSIPNVPRTRADASALRPDGVLLFDSLKSLPTRLPEAAAAAATASGSTSAGGAAGLEAAGKRPGGGEGAKPAAPTAAGTGTRTGTGSQCTARVAPRAPSQHVFERIAASLHQSLGLSLFGFDVVIASEDGTPGDAADARAGMDGRGQAGAAAGGCEGQRGQQGPLQYVVVDVNYFPSFKGAPGAALLFREAVMAAYRRHVGREAGAGDAEEARE